MKPGPSPTCLCGRCRICRTRRTRAAYYTRGGRSKKPIVKRVAVQHSDADLDLAAIEWLQIHA